MPEMYYCYIAVIINVSRGASYEVDYSSSRPHNYFQYYFVNLLNKLILCH